MSFARFFRMTGIMCMSVGLSILAVASFALDILFAPFKPAMQVDDFGVSRTFATGGGISFDPQVTRFEAGTSRRSAARNT